MNKPEVAIIHHTAVGGDTPQFFAVNAYHKSKQFPISSNGYYVGYHYFIEKDGKTWQARRRDDVGAHTIGWNDRSIGICLAGNFNHERPTQRQMTALRGILKDVKLEPDLHRNRQKDRTCPGDNFTLDLIEKNVDIVDNEKEIMIQKMMKKYPSLVTWILTILSQR